VVVVVVVAVVVDVGTGVATVVGSTVVEVWVNFDSVLCSSSGLIRSSAELDRCVAVMPPTMPTVVARLVTPTTRRARRAGCDRDVMFRLLIGLPIGPRWPGT
jgi:hypothetical protein